MISIKNTSDEDLVLIQHLDPTVKGCRLEPPAVDPMVFKPNETIVMTGYEPGISYTIEPCKSPQYPRVPNTPSGGVLKYKAIAPKGVIP